MRTALFSMGLLLAVCTHAQNASLPDTTGAVRTPLATKAGFKAFRLKDGRVLLTGPCKNYFLFPGDALSPSSLSSAAMPASLPAPLIGLHGNVEYEYVHQSIVDTPFAQKDVNQHYLRTNLQVKIRDRYPVSVNIQLRTSNSLYFRNVLEANVLFDRRKYFDNYKEQLRKLGLARLDSSEYRSLEARCTQLQQKAVETERWINSPMRDQELVREAERALREQGVGTLPQPKVALPNVKDSLQARLPGKDSLVANATLPAAPGLPGKANLPQTTVSDRLDSARRLLNEQKEKLADLQKKWQRERKKLEEKQSDLEKKIRDLSDPASFRALADQYGIRKDELPKGYRLLSLVKRIGIGQNWVDYSDLTVKNVSVSGVAAEITPSPFYFAMAAGKVNYRFRDFVLGKQQGPSQQLWAFRAGIGAEEGNRLLLTYYTGHRAQLNPYSTLEAQSAEPISGLSLEGQWRVYTHTLLTLEAARSTFPNYRSSITNTSTKLFNLSEHSNEAYSVKVRSNFPKTHTVVQGLYRHLGERFQSFTAMPSNIAQEAWSLRVTQKLFYDHLSVDAGLRRNDYTSPLTGIGIASKAIFKSLQVSYKKPRFPFLSVGYFPSTQLTMLEDKRLLEMQYQTWNAVASHSYRSGKVGMNSSLVFVRFENESADTGFLYFNSSSLDLSQHFYIGRFSLQTTLGWIDQRELRVFSLEQGLAWQATDRLSLDASLKWNRVQGRADLMGGSGGLNVDLRKLGSLQLRYEKSYLPGTSKNLLPVDMGRLIYYRTF